MSKINDRIKTRRLALGLTLLEVADMLGVKEATAQRYESGKIKNIKHETILKLSEILQCTPAYLMGWSETEKDTDESYLSNPQYYEDIKNLPSKEKDAEIIKLFSKLPADKLPQAIDYLKYLASSSDEDNQ